jgi:hypothetical protein
MATNEKIAGYMNELGLLHKELQEGMWLVSDAAGQVKNIVVHNEAPVVVFRVKIMELEDHGDYSALFRDLLELNASEMIHGAYALEGNTVVAVDTLQSETLDLGEFQASVDSISFAVSTHLPRFKKYFE